MIVIFLLATTAQGSSLSNAQQTKWKNYVNENLGISFDYPSDWTVVEKTNLYSGSKEVQVDSNSFSTGFFYWLKDNNSFDTDSTLDFHQLPTSQDIQLSLQASLIGLKIGSHNHDLQIIEDFNLQKYRIDNKTTATMLYSFKNPYDPTERLTQRDIIVFDYDGKEHNLKYRDSTDEFNSLASRDIMDHIISSFKIHTPTQQVS